MPQPPCPQCQTRAKDAWIAARNVDKLKRQEVPALIADNQMRKRDERLNDQHH